MPNRHAVRALVQELGASACGPQVTGLDELLAARSTRPQARGTMVRPLFEMGQRPLDLSDPAVAEQLEEARVRVGAELQAEQEQILAAERERFAAGCKKLDDAIAKVEKVVTAEVVDLALVVARELVGKELSVEQEQVAAAVEEALASVPHEGDVTLRANPDDIEALLERVPSVGEGRLRVEGDPGLTRGGFIVEMPERIIDASIGSRLAAVRDSLVRALTEEQA